MLCSIQKPNWSLTVSADDHGATVTGGHFGALSVLESPLFSMKYAPVKESAYRRAAPDDGITEITSACGWESVRSVCSDTLLQFWFSGPDGTADLTVVITGAIDDLGISWKCDVINNNPDLTVHEITYPTPRVTGTPLHLFLPDCSGRALTDVGTRGFSGRWDYPGHNMAMQYFAFWGEKGGIYLGIHDPDASMKTFAVSVGGNMGSFTPIFPAIGIGCRANSFSLGGVMRWQVFDGDWYDATMIYAHFVHTEAKWLPVKGRPDTPRKFKEIPFWICDYIPNSPEQMEARPMTLATVSERYGADYWVDAPIALKEALGTPVGYHVYNWHKIPFNINYPHFLPARDTFLDGAKRLRDAGLYLFPYINAVSWEMHDADEGFPENFATVGKYGAAIRSDGSARDVIYPQKKRDGTMTRLVPMCPTCLRWHGIIEEVTRGMEEQLPIDGIYFDQIAAVPSFPCRSTTHSHLPGGGSYWSDGYNRLMDAINAKKPDDKFYFSESNAEPYVKSFDGFLTWVWTTGDDVPAFSAVYAGYIQLLGRYTDGAKRDDDAYFRYHLGEGLLFGQQLGWINAHVVYSEERMRYLKKIVHTRYQYTELFTEGSLLRPPVVTTDLEPVTSSGITKRQVVAGAWKTAKEDKVVVFVVNVSDKEAAAEIRLHTAEYGIDAPVTISLTMEPASVKVFEYRI